MTSSTINQKEALEIINNYTPGSSRRELFPVGTLFCGVDLSGRDLRSINFSNCVFDTVNFQGSDLSGTTWLHTRIRQTNFSKARFLNSTFSGTEITDSCFDCVDFSSFFLIVRSKILRSQLAGSQLKNAYFTSTNLQGSTMPECLVKAGELVMFPAQHQPRRAAKPRHGLCFFLEESADEVSLLLGSGEIFKSPSWTKWTHMEPYTEGALKFGNSPDVLLRPTF